MQALFKKKVRERFNNVSDSEKGKNLRHYPEIKKKKLQNCVVLDVQNKDFETKITYPEFLLILIDICPTSRLWENPSELSFTI